MARVISPERRQVRNQYRKTNAALVVFTAGYEERCSKLRPDFEGRYRDQAAIAATRQHLDWQVPRLYEDKKTGKVYLHDPRIQLMVAGGHTTPDGTPYAAIDKEYILSQLSDEEKRRVHITAVTKGNDTRTDTEALVKHMQKEWPGSHILIEAVTSPFHTWRVITYLSKLGAETFGVWGRKKELLPAETLEEIRQKKTADGIIRREWIINAAIRIDQFFRTENLENLVYKA